MLLRDVNRGRSCPIKLAWFFSLEHVIPHVDSPLLNSEHSLSIIAISIHLITMGLLNRGKNATAASQHVEIDQSHHEDTISQPTANLDPWYRQPELRKLYLNLGFLFLASSTLGYDGSLLNGLQTMNSWQQGESDKAKLGTHITLVPY